jgi:hypothetical protein
MNKRAVTAAPGNSSEGIKSEALIAKAGKEREPAGRRRVYYTCGSRSDSSNLR